MRWKSAVPVGAALCLAALASAPAAMAQSADETAALATVDGFKEALRSGDAEGAMARLHPDVRIFEGGRAETREQYAAGHLAGDMAFLGVVESVTTWSDIMVRDDVAVYLSEYTTKGEVRGREIDSRGTESMVLVRTADGWLIRHIHWSSR